MDTTSSTQQLQQRWAPKQPPSLCKHSFRVKFQRYSCFAPVKQPQSGQVTWLMSEQGEAVPATQHSASLPFVADTKAKQCGV